MENKEVDSASTNLSQKYMLVKTTDLNDFIRRKGYMVARAIPFDELELRDQSNLFVCRREYGRDFYDLISEIYKINCVKCLYEGKNHIKICYLEK